MIGLSQLAPQARCLPVCRYLRILKSLNEGSDLAQDCTLNRPRNLATRPSCTIQQASLIRHLEARGIRRTVFPELLLFTSVSSESWPSCLSHGGQKAKRLQPAPALLICRRGLWEALSMCLETQFIHARNHERTCNNGS